MATETNMQTPETGAPTTTPVSGQKKSGAGKIVLVLIVLVVAFGIYKAAAGNKAPQTPDEVLTRMMRNMGSVKTAEYAGTFKANLTNTKNPLSSIESFSGTNKEAATTSEPVEFTAGFSGVLDVNNIGKPKATVALTLTTPDFTDGQSAEVEFRVLEDSKYFKLNKVPVLGKLNLSSLTNIWVNLDTEALKNQFKPSTSTAVSTTPLSEDKREKIRSIVTGAHIVEVTGDLGDSDVSGVNAYHYKFTVNEAEIMRAAREVHMVTEGKALTIDEEKKMTAFWNGAEVKNGEIWIGKKDFYIYHVVFDLAATTMGDKGASGNFGVDLQMRNFNTPVTVEAPANPSTIIDFVGQVFGIVMAQSMGSALMGGK